MRTYERKRPEPEVINGVEELCRLCLQKDEGVPIFTEENSMYPDMATRIMMCVGIEVTNEEHLPRTICRGCKSELEHCYKFRKRCEVNNRKLKMHIRAMDEMKKRYHNIDKAKKSVKKESELCEIDLEENRMEEGLPSGSKDSSCTSVNSINGNTLNQDETENLLNSEKETQETDELELDVNNSIEQDYGDKDKQVDQQNVQKPQEASLNVRIEDKSLMINELTACSVNLTFLMSKLTEQGVVTLNAEGEIESRDETVTGIQLVTEDGTLVTMKFEEEDMDEVLFEEAEEMDKNPSLSKRLESACGSTCVECGRRYSSPAALRRHEACLHLKKRPYECTHCGKAFGQKAVLTRHMLTHNEDRPHRCELCPKSFTQRLSLAAHMRSHQAPPARPLSLHRCAVCDKVFLYQSGLIRHMRTHAGAAYGCAPCGRRYGDQSSLRRHQRTCHPPKKS